jgi:peptidoglycan hydrolase FlgJ
MTKIVSGIPLPQSPLPTVSQQTPAPAQGDLSEKEQAARKKVAQEFESLFIGMMLKSMRATVGKDSLTGGGQGEEVYRSLLDQEYATAAAKGDGLGLAKLIEQQLGLQSGRGEHDNRTKQ